MSVSLSRARATTRLGHGKPLGDRLFPYLLLLPALVLVLAVMVYPLFLSANMSLRKGTSLNLDQLNSRPVSLDHYVDVLTGPHLLPQLLVSVLYVLGTVVPSMALGVALGLLVSSRFPGRRYLRPLVLLAWAVPAVVVSVAFDWILDDRYGIANRIITGLGGQPIGWLTDPHIALVGVLLPTVWKSFPLFTIATIAARAAIPGELYEAARVDGAGRFTQFRTITLPGINGALALCVILTTLSSFREFDFIYSLTGGGPLRSTETLAVGIYNEAFGNFEFENAAALGIITVLISILIVLVSARRLRKEYF